MRDAYERAILEQWDGKKLKQYCPVCNKNTDFIVHKSGLANCVECKTGKEIDLTDAVKKLKAMGVVLRK